MNFANLLKTLFYAKHLWATASEMTVLRNNMHSFKRSDDKYHRPLLYYSKPKIKILSFLEMRVTRKIFTRAVAIFF